jgi:enamine deaminase RidA (YjgF/YER057c/UK114 family)
MTRHRGQVWSESAAAPAASQREKPLTRRLISSGSTFEREIGYSRAVVDGEWIFVSGTTGFDYDTMSIPEGVVAQTDQCLRNIESALAQAGASLRDVVRVTYVLPDAGEFPQCWPTLRQYFGEVRPAAMMISAGLADPRMRIEIEVTALRRRTDPATAQSPQTA